MKIKVDVKDLKLPICILFPTGLLTNAPVRRLVASCAVKYASESIPYTRQQLERILLELKKAKKRFRRLRLVEVQVGDEMRVIIDL